MKVIMYELQFGAISRIEVEKLTDKTVIAEGRKRRIDSSWQQLYPTFEDAKLSRIEECREVLLRAERRLVEAKDEYEKALLLTEPK
jgi:cob(I)alamin adenosyltransferase